MVIHYSHRPALPRLFCVYIALLLLSVTTLAQPVLPSVFGSHMVLQRQKPVPIWGNAAPGEVVTVQLKEAVQTTTATKTGRWQVNLPPMEAGGPFVLTVSSKSGTVSFTDVLIGEVWLCSGQSNMEWPVSAAKNSRADIRTATYPQIRQFSVAHTTAPQPMTNVAGSWAICSPKTVGAFTAVGYYFARDLLTDLNIPIGLLHTSWGGTHVETWTSPQAIGSDAALRPAQERFRNRQLLSPEQKRAAFLALIRQKQGDLPTPALASTFRQENTNTANWPVMSMPNYIETQLPKFDGIFWARKSIDIPATFTLTGVTLSLGTIDDADSTFVNGQFVGATGTHNAHRTYSLPDNLLRPGPNLIAVRVRDYGGGGGLYGKPDDLALAGSDWSVPLAGSWAYQVAEPDSRLVEDPNEGPSLLYNAMLNPLIPYALRGVLWYQGESNAGRAVQYRTSFPLMITDWRNAWKEPFPFLFVQLANFDADGGNSQKGSAWAELREAQTMTLALPNTGMAVTADIGNGTDIHPTNKQDVGKRLAAEARRVAYGQPGTLSVGPVLSQSVVVGPLVELTLRNADTGLMTPNKYGYVVGFEVAGSDQKFHYAKASIQGNKVLISSELVPVPVAVRYGWADDNGEVNLYNRAGFPATPFRTDRWKTVTEGKTFE